MASVRKTGRRKETEVEITPEMEEAGLDIFECYNRHLDHAPSVVRAIYVAMRRLERGRGGKAVVCHDGIDE